jgi:hypothetical protein
MARLLYPWGKQATHIHFIGGWETIMGPNTLASVGLKVFFVPSRSKKKGTPVVRNSKQELTLLSFVFVVDFFKMFSLFSTSTYKIGTRNRMQLAAMVLLS